MRQQAPPAVEEPRKAESPPIDSSAILNMQFAEIQAFTQRTFA